MSVGAPVAGDIPNIYDLIIEDNGYILANAIAPNLPFRTQRARYGYTPTFLPRSNVSGDYGDSQQDFWQTVSIRDFSLGEDQKYYKTNDAEKARQFWLGSNVNVSVPGQVTINRSAKALTFAAACSGAAAYPAGSVCFTTSSTNLYEINSAGTITDRGAHGVGGQPTAFATDGSFLYLSGSTGTDVRKYDLSAHTFATFSTQEADALVYLNNTLYGTKANILYTYDTAGAATNSFTYKTATGAALPGTMKLLAFGGKVIILRNSGSSNGAELWEYDGTGVAKLAEYPGNFMAKDFCVQSGIIFIIGAEARGGDGNRAAIWYYANGTIGRAWAHSSYSSNTDIGYDITPFGNGLIFTDPQGGLLRFYDLQTGGVSTVATSSVSSSACYLATADTFVLLALGNTSGYLLFDNTTVSTTATIQTSIVDFESSLTKLFRGVIVNFTSASNGDGGSVDIAYQIDDVLGSYTNLKTGATSGVEYTFPTPITGRGISVQVTLNKGASTLGPTLKRIYVRAAPTLSKFRIGEYVIDCTGIRGKTPVQLRNGQSHPLSGQQMIDNLSADATSGGLLTVTDRLGTFTGIVELQNMDLIEVRPNEYYVHFTVREV